MSTQTEAAAHLFRELLDAGLIERPSSGEYDLERVREAFFRHLAKLAGKMATQTEAAQHIDLGDRRFRELIEDGVIERRPPGEYELYQVRVSYLRHIRKVAAGRGTKTDADLATERALLTREQRSAVERNNAVARGDLVSVEEVGRQVEAEYGVVRQILLAISGKLADGLEGMGREERERAIAAEIIEALNELHDPAGTGGGSSDRTSGVEPASAAGAPGAEAAAPSQPH